MLIIMMPVLGSDTESSVLPSSQPRRRWDVPTAMRDVTVCNERLGNFGGLPEDTSMADESMVAYIPGYLMKFCWSLRCSFDGDSQAVGGHKLGTP